MKTSQSPHLVVARWPREAPFRLLRVRTVVDAAARAARGDLRCAVRVLWLLSDALWPFVSHRLTR